MEIEMSKHTDQYDYLDTVRAAEQLRSQLLSKGFAAIWSQVTHGAAKIVGLVARSARSNQREFVPLP
jgi:hypothetical protein